jgi:hypothetical protein
MAAAQDSDTGPTRPEPEGGLGAAIGQPTCLSNHARGPASESGWTGPGLGPSPDCGKPLIVASNIAGREKQGLHDPDQTDSDSEDVHETAPLVDRSAIDIFFTCIMQTSMNVSFGSICHRKIRLKWN